MRVTRQPEYFSKPCGELSWLQRVFLIVHLAVGIPFVLLVVAAPFVGLWMLVFADGVLGAATTAAGVLLWLTAWVANRY